MRLPIAAALLAVLACQPDTASGPLTQEAYVWQRRWTPAVRASVRQAEGLSRLVVLAAEVNPAGGPAVRVPLEGLRTMGRPVGLAVRVLAFPGRFADDLRRVEAVTDAARQAVEEARRLGIEPVELQIDYDCPESKLEDYARLLPALRAAAAPVPIVITALPAWLRQERAFARLIEVADGYVLQVHSLAPPAHPGEETMLCDPEAARRWVERAARFGRPFRVALPTYGYAVAFGPDGRRIGLSAEGPALVWPAGATVRTARSDPEAMAGLVREWTAERPRELQGILWYRLPVAGDRLNWTWPTLRAVMEGRTPRSDVRAVLRKPEPGLVEIDLSNPGEAEISWPPRLRISWKGDNRLLAADGLAGYRVGARDGEARLERTARSGKLPLRPGECRTIAWLRFAADTEVQVEIPSP